MSLDDKKGAAEFRQALRTLVSPDSSYSRYSAHRNSPVRHDYSYEEIVDLINSGNVDALRELSRYYYRISGIYRNAIDLRANMSLYDTVVTPLFTGEGKGVKSKVVKAFNAACKFVDDLNVPVNFSRITRELLLSGVYHGVLRETGDGVVVQDLPLAYCRTRFKDAHGLDILEFDVAYFDRIADEGDRKEALDSFPSEVRKAYYRWRNRASNVQWVEIGAEIGGMSFSFGDKTPILVASIPSIRELDDAVEREAKRDEDELGKLLIQQMPIDSKGQLVFQLDEVADLHASVAEMLQDRDTIDVLTTFGETSLESVQDSTAASQSSDRITKYKDNAYDEVGIASLLFNPDGSSSLPYAIKKEEALIGNINNLYAAWLKYQVNRRFGKNGVEFDFTILPTTIFNRKEMQEQYFRGAQYGYSKMYAGVAMGVKQVNQISLMTFENDMLGMAEKMIPLQSTYTSSGKNVASSSSSGGRPPKDDTEKSEKTVQNVEGK